MNVNGTELDTAAKVLSFAFPPNPQPKDKMTEEKPKILLSVQDFKDNCKSIGKEAAIALYESKWHEGKTHREIAEFQTVTSELCVPFSIYQEAVEKTVGRPVFTHEFGLAPHLIWNEIFHCARALSLTESLDLIPEDKRIVVEIGG